jgi:hypothetical protein
MTKWKVKASFEFGLLAAHFLKDDVLISIARDLL